MCAKGVYHCRGKYLVIEFHCKNSVWVQTGLLVHEFFLSPPPSQNQLLHPFCKDNFAFPFSVYASSNTHYSSFDQLLHSCQKRFDKSFFDQSFCVHRVGCFLCFFCFCFFCYLVDLHIVAALSTSLIYFSIMLALNALASGNTTWPRLRSLTLMG